VQVQRSPMAENFWTQGQVAEMAVFPAAAVALGGIGELRGNGRLSGEQRWSVAGAEWGTLRTIDLTLRLHLDQWDIELSASAVKKRA